VLLGSSGGAERRVPQSPAVLANPNGVVAPRLSRAHVHGHDPDAGVVLPPLPHESVDAPGEVLRLRQLIGRELLLVLVVVAREVLRLRQLIGRELLLVLVVVARVLARDERALLDGGDALLVVFGECEIDHDALLRT
jgi:hypothetical protein